MKEFHLHLVSDSTGETVSSVARATVAQFDDVEAHEHVWPLVRTKGQLEKVITGIDSNPGIVMYTLVDKNLRESAESRMPQAGTALCAGTGAGSGRALGASGHRKLEPARPPARAR